MHDIGFSVDDAQAVFVKIRNPAVTDVPDRESDSLHLRPYGEAFPHAFPVAGGTSCWQSIPPVDDDVPTRKLGANANLTAGGLVVGQRVFGRYTLESLAGRGGMGVVWRARDEDLEREVALKFLLEIFTADLEAVRDLKRETRRCLELTHPNIVRVHDFVKEAPMAAIAMEYVAGESLTKRKVEAHDGCLTVGELAPLVPQLCEALDYAHQVANVVHRDLKPANILVTAAGVVKVTDFGISRNLSDSGTRLTGRMVNTSGTLPYMSPQQLLGMKPSASDDIYALGASLYELLAGKPPFYVGDVSYQVLNLPPEGLAKRRAELGGSSTPFPRAWEETIWACLSKEPKDRPQSVGEVAERLGLRRSRPEVKWRAPKIHDIRPKLRSLEPRFILGSLAILVLFASVALYLVERRSKALNREGALNANTGNPGELSGTGVGSSLPGPRTVATDSFETAKYRTLAMSGDVDAAMLLGYYYLMGYGVGTDEQEASKWLQFAAAKGHKFAAALAKQNGLGTVADVPAAVAAYREMAGTGDKFAENQLGFCFSNGIGVKRDDFQSRNWYEKAAKQGFPPAEIHMGDLYYNGLGVAKDNSQALSWYQKAAYQGYAPAKNGGGATGDFGEALKWLGDAAGRKFSIAQDALGWMYSNGYGVSKDSGQALKWYLKAADEGNAQAQFNLGEMYYGGQGLAKDYGQALGWFLKAADQGSARAQFMVGEIYCNGQGVPRDTSEAIRWYNEAAAQGQPDAQQALKRLGVSGK